jgi:hypothetical protein
MATWTHSTPVSTRDQGEPVIFRQHFGLVAVSTTELRNAVGELWEASERKSKRD